MGDAKLVGTEGAVVAPEVPLAVEGGADVGNLSVMYPYEDGAGNEGDRATF